MNRFGNGIGQTGTDTIVRSVEDILDKVPYRSEFRMFKSKNNIKIAALYALYLEGNSLDYIAKVIYRGRFTRQCLYDSFKARGYKMRSKKLKLGREYKGRVYRVDSCGHYRNRVNGIAIYLHRVLWEEQNGKIPADYYLIFKDGNKENIVIENLECISSMEAKKRYNHANQMGYKRFKDKGAFGK